jgi:hypothetical protein
MGKHKILQEGIRFCAGRNEVLQEEIRIDRKNANFKVNVEIIEKVLYKDS